MRPPGTTEDASDERDTSTVSPQEVVGATEAEGESSPLEDGDEEEYVELPPPPARYALAAGFPVLAAAVMVGGIFQGFSPRLYAGVAGLFGVGLAYAAVRVRRPLAANAAVVGGLFGIGLLMIATRGPGNIFEVRELVAEAVASGNVLRPPVPFVIGWYALVGWLMGVIGFVTGWVSMALRKPAFAVLLPLPVAGFAGISVPESAQVASGVAVLVLFVAGLAALSSATQAEGELGEDEEDIKPPLAFQLRKAAKGVPILIGISVAMVLLSKTGFLFPDPAYDPAQEAQKPKTVPLSEVQDRVLFEVESELSGPWRIGSLDVYDGTDWRLPAFAASELNEVPRNGIVDPDLDPEVRATFTVAGLGGAVLPGLPNPVGIIAQGPLLAFDDRSDNIRLVAGQAEPGTTYTVAAAGLPTIEELRKTPAEMPDEVQEFLDIPTPPPPAVQTLIDQAPKESKWDTFDFLRTWVLEEIVATGSGVPVSITPDRAQEILAESREASPFEIVALQGMLARWVGVPSRIGYGFDGGEEVDGKLQVRPRHGATFVEVYFPGFKWLPVIGTPKQAKPTSGADASQQRTDPNVLPSEDIAVRLTLPVVGAPPSQFGEQVRNIIFVVVPLLLLALLTWVLTPAVVKAYRRGRNRSEARELGARARVALAYAEWRDVATDFGCRYPSDTPLQFLRRFPPDAEHRELAWLTTRALWGDLQEECTPELAAMAEELSRALRKRMAMAQPGTLRAVALVSRLSMKDPFVAVPPTKRQLRRAEKREEKESREKELLGV
ncbi:MAG TPA: transglutaminase domain-containing protein [Acidimicrobiales bacterium]|nr:transglutaminase domain-containing protein [Acidimicrobiales bacterium]